MVQIWDAIVGLGPWAWLILAAILFAMETVLPGVFLVWFGAAAAIVGILLFFVDIGWELQLVIFSAAAVISVVLMRGYGAFLQGESDEPNLNERGAQLVGRTVVVDTAIRGGRGRVRVGDGLWLAEGPDMEHGASARVVGVNGTTLVVEPVEEG